MTDLELLTLSTNLKKDADEVVRSLNLLEIANKYCECHQIGSSVLDLMVDEDIDFTCYVTDSVDINKCFDFAKELVQIPTVDKLKIKNYLENPDYFQFKVYIDPYKYRNRDWQIAFSFQTKTDQLVKSEIEFISWVKSKLTSENKLTILRLKVQTREQNLKIPGALIYKAVLSEGITDIKLLNKYLKNYERVS